MRCPLDKRFTLRPVAQDIMTYLPNTLLKHLIPNVMPLVFTDFTLFIPGAILAEASLSFLGFGDPNLMTWGKMINKAMNFGAFVRQAWWWIFPPGFAIMILSAGFIFMSHALDQILNPRLRRRR